MQSLLPAGRGSLLSPEQKHPAAGLVAPGGGTGRFAPQRDLGPHRSPAPKIRGPGGAAVAHPAGDRSPGEVGEPRRMAENLDIFDFTLSPEELADIAALDRGHTCFPPRDTGKAVVDFLTLAAGK